MGNCVPIQRNSDPPMKVKCSIRSEANRVQMESPVKDNKVSGDHLIAELNSKPQSLPMSLEASLQELSNLEEFYFDSQPCLDSDNEDFISVDGDLTPSHGTSPVHLQTSLVHSPPPNDASFNISSSNEANSIAKPEAEPPKPDIKKQLFELFQEGFHSDSSDGQQNLQGRVEVEVEVEAKTLISTAHLPHELVNNESTETSRCSSETSSLLGRFNLGPKKKPGYSAPRCIPNLVRSLSFADRKKKLSPANSYGQ